MCIKKKIYFFETRRRRAGTLYGLWEDALLLRCLGRDWEALLVPTRVLIAFVS